MKIKNILTVWLLIFSIISSIKADEPNADQVLSVYNEFLGKFKNKGVQTSLLWLILKASSNQLRQLKFL